MSNTICTTCGRDIRACSDCPWCSTEVTIYQSSFPQQAIVTKYHNMTPKSDARVSARCSAGHIFLPWDTDISREENYRAAARALCAKFKWKGPLVHGMLDDGSHVFVQAPKVTIESEPQPSIISASDLREFTGYLVNCSNAQLRGTYYKEKEAGRDMYVVLAEQEASRRGVEL